MAAFQAINPVLDSLKIRFVALEAQHLNDPAYKEIIASKREEIK